MPVKTQQRRKSIKVNRARVAATAERVTKRAGAAVKSKKERGGGVKKIRVRHFLETNNRGGIKANLVCSAGHKAFSPTPKKWVGRTCHAKGCYRKVQLIGKLKKKLEAQKRHPKRISRI